MWKLKWASTCETRLKRLCKAHPKEIGQTLKNLETYKIALENGVKPMQIVKLNFVRNAQLGIHEIDQTPLKKGKLAIRLYVYPSESEKTLYLLTIGDKDQQENDIRECSTFVRDLRKKLDANQSE